MSFGEKLTKLRKERGMSQEDLASNLNVSRQAVSKWESNNSYPETEKIVAICKLFNCSMDELIGLKEGKVKKDNKIFNIINEYFDKFFKAIKMFYSMTLKQKIKCFFEMFFYFIVLFIIFLIAREILIEIIKKLLYLLPNELLIVLIQTFDGLFDLVYVIFIIYALAKMYKVRYLDYYENYLLEKNKDELVILDKKEAKVEKINIKEEKIIIRDADNEFKPFHWIKRIMIIFVKIIASLVSVCLGVTFVLLIAGIVFVLYFIDSGLLIIYIACCLLGILIGVYVFLEILIKYIFNMTQKPKRLFIMFIIAMIIVGLSCGFFGCEITTFSVIDSPEYDKLIYKQEVEMKDDLIISFLKYSNTKIVLEERDNILVELYGTDLNISPIEISKENVYCHSNTYSEPLQFERHSYYNYYDYINGTTFNDVIRNMLKTIKNKELVSESYFFEVVPKVYISKDNYEKLLQNNEKCIYYTYNSEYYYE